MVVWEQFKGSPGEWDKINASFDGSFYQTYGWAEVRRVAGWKPIRVVAMEKGIIVAAASILVRKKFGLAICWIPGGPIGRIDVICQNFKTNLTNWTKCRLLYCRVSLQHAESNGEVSVLEVEGWKRPRVAMSSGLTMSYSLVGTEEERKSLASKNWKRNLKRSARHELCVEHWKVPDVDKISALYREMEELKSLSMQHSKSELNAVLKYCHEHIVVYRCTDVNGKLLAVRAAGLSGSVAMDLLAAAGKEARKIYASHATLWALLNHCAADGIKDYDLSGVDPEKNKGVFNFKQGTGAKLVQCIGEWEWASAPGLSTLLNWFLASRNR